MKLLKKLLFLPAFILLLPMYLNSIGLLLPVSAQAAATSNFSLIGNSIGAVNINPSITVNGIEFTVNRLYNLDELPRYLFYAGMKWRKFGFALGMADLNNYDYNELTTLLNTSYNLSDFSAGFNLSYHRIDITNKGNRDALSLDLGLSWSSGIFKSAFSWHNCTESKLAKDNIPVYFIWENAVTLDTKIVMGFKLEKETGFEFHPAIATSFSVYHNFQILTSYSLNPQNIGCGFIVNIKNTSVAYAATYHPELDFTHYLTLSYGKPAAAAVHSLP
jgi:hypothetical protein